MKVQEVFKKSIHRPINGVVQAGQLDEKTIKNELEEYVMTEEGTDYLVAFYKNYLAMYQNPSTSVGVWISGFFGSGKSHFLKILSYLLDNKLIDQKSPVDYFEEKTRSGNLLSMMKEVAEKDSDAILFNIDSKTTTNSAEKDRIVEVFLRVFNRHLGYSDTLWIAEMERQLDSDGKYSEFKEAILKVSNTQWEELRLKAVLKKRKIIQALVDIGYEEDVSKDFFDINRNTFEMSSENLSELIGEYCKKRGAKYRLVFLVDEVGQYIGTNTSLMLNLQTVVEDFGNRCRGQAWVVVTSQEKIESSVANLDSTKDFSKIQGRFATRINLSSSNTDEVIKRRLLDKKEDAVETLKPMYEQEEQMIKNRLAFDHHSTQLRSGYRSVEEFVELYPFIPYQVDLLQKIFNKIRNQGEGGVHLAHGERSLLKGFQEAAQLKSEEKVRSMVTLAEFYPSIRGFLESSITSTIARAEDRAKNQEGLKEEDIPVLKVLYLIKGIDEIKSTSNNIATLLLETIYDERQPLEYRIKESLNRLQQAMLIEQHADGTYSFLSDEEQEINKEIRVEEVNHVKIKEKLGDLFFTSMGLKPKYNYKGVEMPFDYSKRFDNYNKGQMTHPLTMQVYSQKISDAEAVMQADSGRLIICLDEELIAEAENSLKYVEQVQSYVRRKHTGSSNNEQIKIYDIKLEQVDEFTQKAQELMKKSCDDARFFIQGQERSYKGNFENRVDSALEMLIKNTYSKIHYVDTPIPYKAYKDKWIKLAEEGLGYDLLEERSNHNAIEELNLYIERLARNHEKKTLKEVIEYFRDIPYGWSEYDIIGVLLVSLNEGKVKLKYANDPFTPQNNQFIERLSRITERDKIVVLPVVAMDSKVKRDVMALIRDFFGMQVNLDTYEEFSDLIKQEINTRFQKPIEEIRNRRRKNPSLDFPYPGEKDLNNIGIGIQKFLNIRDAEQFVNEFTNLEDDIEEWIETIEKLKAFYSNTPIEKFDEASDALSKYKQDLTIIRSEEVKNTETQIRAILIQENPYREIPKLHSLIKTLEEKINEEIELQRQATLIQIETIDNPIWCE